MRWFEFLGRTSFCAACLCALGCEVQNSQTQSIAARQADESSVNAAREAMVSRAATDLEAAGAKAERASDGLPTGVDLTGIEVTDAIARAVAQLPSLEKLTIVDSSMSIDGWRALSKLKALQQLDLRGCAVDNEQLTAAVSGMTSLKGLRMSGKSGKTTVDDAGLAVLGGCPELKALAVDGLWITVDGVKHLSSNGKLAEFYAGGTALDDDAAALLASLPALKKLRLSQTGIGTPGLEALSELTLIDLDVSECSGITNESLVVIGSMKSLERLNLWRDTVDDEGIEHLAELRGLKWLNLDNTHVTDAGLESLSEMKQLTFLHLGSTGVTDDGMSTLLALKSLKDLKVTRTAVTQQGVEILKRSIPNLSVQIKYIESE